MNLLKKPADQGYLIEKVIKKYCKNKVILDLGCGNLKYSKITKKVGAKKVIALDIVKPKRLVKGIKFIKTDAHKTPFRNSSFDIIICNGLIEYLDLERGINEIKRLVKPGGFVIFQTKDSRGLAHKIYRFYCILWSKSLKGMPQNYKKMKQLLENNFEILEEQVTKPKHVCFFILRKFARKSLNYLPFKQQHYETPDAIYQPAEKVAITNRLKWVLKELERYNVKKILDIGCGAGFTTDILSKEGYDVRGIDYNKGIISIARKRYPYLKFSVGEASKYKKGEYGAIVALELIEHIRYYRKALKNWFRMLNKNGILILSTPNVKYSKCKNPFHYNEFSYEDLKRMFPGSKIYGSAWHYISTRLVSFLFGTKNAVKFRYFFDFIARKFPKLSNSFYIKIKK